MPNNCMQEYNVFFYKLRLFFVAFILFTGCKIVCITSSRIITILFFMSSNMYFVSFPKTRWFSIYFIFSIYNILCLKVTNTNFDFVPPIYIFISIIYIISQIYFFLFAFLFTIGVVLFRFSHLMFEIFLTTNLRYCIISIIHPKLLLENVSAASLQWITINRIFYFMLVFLLYIIISINICFFVNKFWFYAHSLSLRGFCFAIFNRLLLCFVFFMFAFLFS